MNFQQTRVKMREKGGNAAHRTQRGTLFPVLGQWHECVFRFRLRAGQLPPDL
jgi:hypothetical protein